MYMLLFVFVLYLARKIYRKLPKTLNAALHCHDMVECCWFCKERWLVPLRSTLSLSSVCSPIELCPHPEKSCWLCQMDVRRVQWKIMLPRWLNSETKQKEAHLLTAEKCRCQCQKWKDRKWNYEYASKNNGYIPLLLWFFSAVNTRLSNVAEYLNRKNIMMISSVAYA